MYIQYIQYIYIYIYNYIYQTAHTVVSVYVQYVGGKYYIMSSVVAIHNRFGMNACHSCMCTRWSQS